MRIELTLLIAVAAAAGCGDDAAAFPADRFDFLFQGQQAPELEGGQFTIDSDRSLIAFSRGETCASIVPSGAVSYTLENCSAGACDLTIDDIQIQTPALQLGKLAIQNIVFEPQQPMTGEKRDTGLFIVNRISVDIVVSGDVSGDQRSGEFFPENDLAGTISPSTNDMVFSGTLVRSGSPAPP